MNKQIGLKIVCFSGGVLEFNILQESETSAHGIFNVMGEERLRCEALLDTNYIILTWKGSRGGIVSVSGEASAGMSADITQYLLTPAQVMIGFVASYGPEVIREVFAALESDGTTPCDAIGQSLSPSTELYFYGPELIMARAKKLKTPHEQMAFAEGVMRAIENDPHPANIYYGSSLPSDLYKICKSLKPRPVGGDDSFLSDFDGAGIEGDPVELEEDFFEEDYEPTDEELEQEEARAMAREEFDRAKEDPDSVYAGDGPLSAREDSEEPSDEEKDEDPPAEVLIPKATETVDDRTELPPGLFDMDWDALSRSVLETPASEEGLAWIQNLVTGNGEHDAEDLIECATEPVTDEVAAEVDRPVEQAG